MQPVNTSPSVGPPLARTPSLATDAYETIRDMIITLEIRPGSLIRLEELSRRLGIGRTPVHEAIKRLESEQLVTIYPRRGTFVTEVNINDLSLLTDVRIHLEGQAAYRAAERATSAERDLLRALMAEIEGRGEDHASLIGLDSRIHRATYSCAHNRYLEATLTQHYNLILRIWHIFLDRLPSVSDHIVELGPLLECVIEGNGERARNMVTRHVASFERLIHTSILEPEGRAAP